MNSKLKAEHRWLRFPTLVFNLSSVFSVPVSNVFETIIIKKYQQSCKQFKIKIWSLDNNVKNNIDLVYDDDDGRKKN
jgi:hypothetical protein